MKLLTLTALLLTGCATMPADYGIPNLRQVAPTAWRSGQPTTPEQWSYLRSLGVGLVVKLDCDDEGGGDDDHGAEADGLQVQRICLHPRTDGWGIVELWRGPSDEQLRALDNLARAIALNEVSGSHVSQRNQQVAPQTIDRGDHGVLIHCVNGRERTGLLAGMVVRYRYGWTRGQAYGYMLDTGFRSQAVGAARGWKRWNETIYSNERKP
jgi:hypothetical protein